MIQKLLLILICSIVISCGENFRTFNIIYSSPLNESTGVHPEFFVEIEFNNDVNKNDVEQNFNLSGDNDVSGSFRWTSERRFSFIPGERVTKTGRYVMEIPRSIRDIDGNTMNIDFISEFYIGADFTPPEILSSDPKFTDSAAPDISVKQNITVNFSKSMNRESVEKAFSITPNISGYFVWSENISGMTDSRFTYTLLSDLGYGKLYSFTISKSGSDCSGNSLSLDYKVNFITGNDFTPPQINGIYDADSILPAPSRYMVQDSVNPGFEKTLKIAVDFSEAMDRTSVENAFFITPSVHGNYKWESDLKMIFTPAIPLDPERNYQITIDKSAKDINGLKQENVYSVHMKTSGENSRYVKCGNIQGSADGIKFTTLSAGIPAQSSWPIIITMDSVIPYSQDYYIRIEFVSEDEPYTPVNINKYSVIDNALIETFKSDPSIEDAGIVDFICENSSTLTLKINPLTNKNIPVTPALYRLTIPGGSGGISDLNGNPLQSDIVIEFREALR